MLHYAVGEGTGARNQVDDVRTLKKVLNRRIDLLVPLRLLPENGFCDTNTKAAIRHVQSKFLRNPDGLVEPFKQTILTLWPPAYANPTNRTVRGTDSFGSGAYGASRDNGARTHQGSDYVSAAGQSVRAPLSGLVTRIVRPYGSGIDAHVLSGLEIWASDGAKCKVLYMQPSVAVGSVVQAGEAIGTAQSLQNRYPGITDHVHVQIQNGQGTVINPTTVVH